MYRNDLPVPGSYGRFWGPQYPQQDQATEMLKAIMPMMMVMPGITSAQTIVDGLRTELAALPVPALAAAQPTKPEFDALVEYTKKCASIVDRSALAASTGYAAIRRQFLFALLMPLLTGGFGGGMGGNGGIAFMMMAMMFMSNGNPFF